MGNSSISKLVKHLTHTYPNTDDTELMVISSNESFQAHTKGIMKLLFMSCHDIVTTPLPTQLYQILIYLLLIKVTDHRQLKPPVVPSPNPTPLPPTSERTTTL